MDKTDFDHDPLKFAGLIAHQVQSPLSAVGQTLQSVLAEYAGPLSPRQRGFLEKANLRCEQAARSVRRMLAIIQAQEGAIEVTPAHLPNVLRHIQSQYAESAAQRGMKMIMDLQLDAPHVRVSEPALTEMFVALVNNALKYTPDHGHVRIAATASSDGQAVVVRVGDSGIGIADGEREKIFKPFFRSSSARESSRPGVGIGLAFVKSILQAAGGSVTVDRSDLGGAEFILEIPTVIVTPQQGQETARASGFNVVIIGGVAAGPKAAAKIIRLKPDADVTVIEQDTFMSYAGCGLPYYVSGLVRNQRGLISSPAGVVRDPIFFRNVKNVHVMNRHEALQIDRVDKRVEVVNHADGTRHWLPYDKLLLATGSSAVIPRGLETDLQNVFTLHGVHDAEGIRTVLSDSRAHDVVIVGGGLVGIEITEALVTRGARVTILEKESHILPVLDPDIAALLERHLAANGVRVVTGTRAEAFEGAGAVRGVHTDNGTFPADMVILAIGVKPNVGLAVQAGLDLGETGAVEVDEFMRTSDPDIYAAGDCVQTTHQLTGNPCYWPMGSVALRQARTAAVNICGGSDAFGGVMTSCICKVFDYSLARTGLGEDAARKAGFDVVTVLVPGPDRAHYMPSANLLLLKLVVDRTTRRLLGAQATGAGAADKRIDVAAMAIAAGMTVDDLANVDLCYAPPYASAMDNIITAANVARNILDGLMTGVKPEEVWHRLKHGPDFVLLDVRTPEEYERVRLPHAVSIPLGSLRARSHELPRDKEIVTYCDISLRGYEGALILNGAGLDNVRVLEGGIAMWPYDRIE